MRSALYASVLLLSSAAVAAPDERRTPEVLVESYLVHVGDVLADLDPATAAFEVGPAPSANGSRVIDRDEIVRAFRAHDAEPPRILPAAVRVVRKMQRVEPREIGELVRAGLGESLPRGVTVTDVRGARASVPAGFTHTTCRVPRLPHKTGAMSVQASLTFWEKDQALWRISVPVDVSLSQEATIYDVSRGGHVTLVIRRGLVEVSASGTAAADADVGDLLPVVLLPSGRTIGARLEDKDHAVAVGAP